ncbi:MAG: MFS transporter [Anaerolineae bacterium]|nr:MFS transporter [Anaerolineae bacterium]
MDTARPPSARRVVLLMTLGHAINDLYANALTPILPVLIEQFGLSMTQAGLVTTLRMLSGQVSQPLYGLLGDRLGRRWLLGLGPLLTVTLMGFSGWAPTYGVLILCVVLAGVGSASFHPQGAAVAGQASGRRHGLGMGIFLAGGIVGVAIAPWVVVPLVSRYGLRATLFAAAPGILVGAYLWRQERDLPQVRAAARRAWRLDLGGSAGPLALLLAIAVFRTVMESSMITFLPVLMRQRGFSLMGAGAVLSLFLLCIGVASVLGGYLGDRWDPRRVIGVSLVLGIPFLQWSLRAEGLGMVLLWIGSGVLFLCSASVNVALAQRLAPGHEGVASSIMSGLGLGLGSVGATLAGRLADSIGLVPAFWWLSWLPLLPAALAFLLPPMPRAPVEAAAGEAQG